MSQSREYSYKILTLMDTGVIEPEDLVEMLVLWASEKQMKDLYVHGPLAEVRANALNVEFAEED